MTESVEVIVKSAPADKDPANEELHVTDKVEPSLTKDVTDSPDDITISDTALNALTDPTRVSPETDKDDPKRAEERPESELPQ